MAETTVEEETPAAEERKSNRRKHRSAYPTPGFKAFGALLHVLALPLASLLITTGDSGIGEVAIGALAGIGLVLALYSNTVKPLATNVKTRKILTGVVAGYGFLVLIALAVTYLLA